MSKICQITGKKAMGGCNVSHSKRHTKRTFDVNLFRRKFYWVEQDVWIELNVSAAGLRTINKIGLDNALKQATVYGDVSFLTPEFIKNITDIFIRALSFIKVACS